VKRQTVILVLIGVILFIAGSAIAYASVEGASKNAGNGSTVAPVTTTAVVAKSDIPAGTTGQAMVSSGLVAIELVPAKSYSPTDLSSLAALNNEVLTAPVPKGHAITSTVLTASTSSISLPQGLNGVTITLTGVQGLAGYLQPGSRVDVYANITKTASTGPSTTLPIPCTELAMANIEVMDVQSTAPAFSSHPSSAGRTIPTAETLLLAVTPNQARSIEFLSQNESLSVVQTQNDLGAPPVNACIGANQTTAAP
jgi:Flp pilus assembly protein CpaB